MLPLRFFRDRAFSAANGASLAMYFGMFGSIFLLSQFFQTAQGYSPFEAGLRVLPWTAMPMVVAPIAGALSDRIGGRPFLAGGLALQSIGLGWIAAVSEADVAYSSLVGPFILSGIGMGMFFAPVANVVLSRSALRDEGKASGASNAIREVGGVFGVAVLASIFARVGGYETPEIFTEGLVAAVWVGAAVVGVGALIALLVPGKKRGRGAGRPALEARLDRPLQDVSQGLSLGHVLAGRSVRRGPSPPAAPAPARRDRGASRSQSGRERPLLERRASPLARTASARRASGPRRPPARARPRPSSGSRRPAGRSESSFSSNVSKPTGDRRSGCSKFTYQWSTAPVVRPEDVDGMRRRRPRRRRSGRASARCRRAPSRRRGSRQAAGPGHLGPGAPSWRPDPERDRLGRLLDDSGRPARPPRHVPRMHVVSRPHL